MHCARACHAGVSVCMTRMSIPLARMGGRGGGGQLPMCSALSLPSFLPPSSLLLSLSLLPFILLPSCSPLLLPSTTLHSPSSLSELGEPFPSRIRITSKSSLNTVRVTSESVPLIPESPTFRSGPGRRLRPRRPLHCRRRRRRTADPLGEGSAAEGVSGRGRERGDCHATCAHRGAREAQPDPSRCLTRPAA
jgi:hypothetical protein